MENNDVNERLSKLQPNAEWEPSVANGLMQFREGRRVHRIRARRKMGIAIGLAVTVLAGLAFPVTRGLAERYATACMSLVGYLSYSGIYPAYTNIDYRKPAPAFTLTDSKGRSISLSGLRGKVVLLAFWIPNCEACETEMSWFKQFEQEYGKQRFVFLDHQAAQGADALVDSFGGLSAIPTALLIDKYGRIAVTHGGFCSRGEFETAIRALLNES
jgi:peroxiredoxin